MFRRHMVPIPSEQGFSSSGTRRTFNMQEGELLAFGEMSTLQLEDSMKAFKRSRIRTTATGFRGWAYRSYLFRTPWFIAGDETALKVYTGKVAFGPHTTFSSTIATAPEARTSMADGWDG